jgi:hypothetical protein
LTISSGKVRTFIFTDRRSDRIIFVKRSRSLNYHVEGTQWKCYEIASREPLLLRADGKSCWRPEMGVRPAAEPRGKELARFRLLRRKLEILTAVRASLHVTWSRMLPPLEGARFPMDQLQPVAQAKLNRLMRGERAILRKRMQVFFARILREMEIIGSVRSLEEFYNFLRDNVTLGAYAALSRDFERQYGEATES